MRHVLIAYPLLLLAAVLAAPAYGATLITPGGDTTVVFKGVADGGAPVVFSTRARLSPLDRDSAWDLYARFPGATARLVSTGDGSSASPAYPTFNRISGAGGRIVFSTRARLLPADDDSASDVYERDGSVTRLLTGGRRDLGAYFKGASLDASRVVFQTKEPLTTDDKDVRYDVYRAVGGAVARLSNGPAGGNGPFDAGLSEFAGRFAAGEEEEVSPDGQTVAFRTAERLTVDDDNADREPYLYEAGRLSRLSPGRRTGPYRSVSFGPASKDFSHVYFTTTDRLVPDDTDDAPDLYEHTAAGPRRVIGSPAASIARFWAAPDGERLILATDNPLVPEDTDLRPDVYERMADGGIRLLSPRPPGAYQHDYGVRIAINFTRVRGVGLNEERSRVFAETQDQLSAADTDHRLDVYELRAGEPPRLLSAGPAGGNTDCRPYTECNAYFAGAGANGGRVLFQTSERLTPDDLDDRSDVYLNENGAVRKVSRGNGDLDAIYRAISADGLTLLYSTAERLSSADGDRSADIYSEAL